MAQATGRRPRMTLQAVLNTGPILLDPLLSTNHNCHTSRWPNWNVPPHKTSWWSPTPVVPQLSAQAFQCQNLNLAKLVIMLLYLVVHGIILSLFPLLSFLYLRFLFPRFNKYDNIRVKARKTSAFGSLMAVRRMALRNFPLFFCGLFIP